MFRLLSYVLLLALVFAQEPICYICMTAGYVPGLPSLILDLPGVPSKTSCETAYKEGIGGLISALNCRLLLSDSVNTACACKKASPVKAPVKAPIKKPIKTPIKTTVKKPVKAPVKAPVKKPVKKPVKTPVKSPVKTPVKL